MIVEKEASRGRSEIMMSLETCAKFASPQKFCEDETLVNHAVRSTLLTLADIDHEHHAKLERLRLSRMPMVWQEEIAETLRREHDTQRAAYVQRLRELDDEVSADDART